MAPQILRNLARAGRKNPLAWQYLFNCLPTLSYKINSSVLSKEARRVKDDLNAHGVAMTSVDALLASNRCYPELLEAIQILENDIEEELDTARSSSEDIGPGKFLFRHVHKSPLLQCMAYLCYRLRPS